MALSLKQPVRLAADAAAAAPRGLVQEVVRLKGSQVAQKEAVLLALCSRSFSSGRTIVFTRTKQRAHRLKILFGLCKLPPAGESRRKQLRAGSRVGRRVSRLLGGLRHAPCIKSSLCLRPARVPARPAPPRVPRGAPGAQWRAG